MRGLLKFVLFVLAVVVLFIVLYAKVSPDFHYIAIKVGDPPDIHYLIIDTQTRRGIFKTFAEYSTPNDVKAATFSADSNKFAAAYHYNGGVRYTWVGIWSTETGDLLKHLTLDGWTTDLTGVFD